MIEAVAVDPADKVETVPIEIVGETPAVPCGIPRFRIGFALVPVIVTVAVAPADSVVTLPMVNTGLVPAAPVLPVDP